MSGLELAEIEQGSADDRAPKPAPAPGVLWSALLMAAILFMALGAGVARWSATDERPAAGDPIAFKLTVPPVSDSRSPSAPSTSPGTADIWRTRQ